MNFHTPFDHSETSLRVDSEGVRREKEYARYQQWILDNAGYLLLWDSWQSRLVEVPDRTSVFDKAKVMNNGLWVVNVHTGDGYIAGWGDLRGVTPLEALALCAA